MRPENVWPKIDPELKAGWIADLRSGVFPQTRRILADARGYCCLGVLGLRLGIPKGDMCDHGDPNHAYHVITNSLSDDLRLHCAAMNDRGDSFSEIADWLETNV